MSDLDYYLQLVIGKDAGLIFLCVFGAVLNGIMLYMLLSKKQIRSSVHTVYMVQIAMTDLLVCIVWLVLTSVITHHLIQKTSDPTQSYEPNYTEDAHNNKSDVKSLVTSGTSLNADHFRVWRILYSWYNFHYYTNIFLLASMSVERCAAVWKSMRCQRYQYNKKAIIGVSILMWILALAFVMPTLINPDLMVSDSDSPSSVSRTISSDEILSDSPGQWDLAKTSDTLSQVFRERQSLKDNEILGVSENGHLMGEKVEGTVDHRNSFVADRTYQADLETLYECYTLLLSAHKNNGDYVRDIGNISVEGCFIRSWAIAETYDPYYKDQIEKNYYETKLEDGLGNYNSEYPLDYGDKLDFGDFEEEFPENNLPTEPLLLPIYNATTNKLEAMGRFSYQILLVDAVKALLKHHYESTKNQACDPHLSEEARIYVLVVNLVLGFFIPFAIIVFSYISIAYMIGKRARSRMQPQASETSTTHFVTHYLQNQSTTNIPAGAVNMREKPSRNPRPSDSMGRRMSDFMRYVLLRKPQGGNDNRTYWTDSENECAPYDSLQQRPYSSSSKRYEESSGTNAKSDNGVCPSARSMNTPEITESSPSQEENPPYDAELQEAIRQLYTVQLRHNRNEINSKVNPRIKKYSICDATNENIPQTIEEHPFELEDTEDDQYLTASAGAFSNDSASPMGRNHAALLMVLGNSRRESGGSYGSSMDSMATDQTSLITSLHDKRYSAATTTSALTPPTPIEPSNPNSNAFFPNKNEKLPYNRSQSAESTYPLLGESRESYMATDQRSPRLQKPGSQLNDITLKLYRKSLQKKQTEEVDFDNLNAVNESEEPSDAGTSRAPITSRASYPRMTRSKSAPEERMNSVQLNARSTSRLGNDQQKMRDRDERQSISQYPKYHRQNSSTSTVFYQRGRTYSTTSRGSASGTLVKTMARKNAERHLRVSRTVLAYVIVFAICWLPQRIAYLLYVIEALMGATDDICIKLISGTRLLSFISVLLNPAVYMMTQRDLRSYVRNTACVTKLRHWYAKCTRKTVRRDIQMESRNPPPSSDRNQDMELQMKHQVPEERDLSNNRPSNGARSPYRMSSPTRNAIHSRKSSGGGQHEIFAPGTAIPARHRDATIDEMKEEEAAAEESLEKEMERLAAEEQKRNKDDINRNWLESSEDDVISAKNTSGSGNKTTSSSSKSENFEEFWMRWLQSGGADLLSPPSGDLSSTDTPSAIESAIAEFRSIAQSKNPTSPNNEATESLLLK